MKQSNFTKMLATLFDTAIAVLGRIANNAGVDTNGTSAHPQHEHSKLPAWPQTLAQTTADDCRSHNTPASHLLKDRLDPEWVSFAVFKAQAEARGFLFEMPAALSEALRTRMYPR